MFGYIQMWVSYEALAWFLLIVPIVCFVGGYYQALVLYPDWADDQQWELPEGTPHATEYRPRPTIWDDMETIPVYTTPYMTRCEDDLTWVEGIHNV